MERAAPVGLWLVAASQVIYLVASFATGQIGLGTIADAASVGCAAVCAAALRRGDRTSFAWGLAAFAGVQLADYLTTLGRINPFFVGFTFVVIGLAVAAVSALQWRKEGVDVPRPTGVRLGAGIVSLGAFSYLVGGFLTGANLGPFTVGALAAGVGWTLVALT